MNINKLFLNKSDKIAIEQNLQHRLTFIHHPIHNAANLLDPSEKGKALTEEEQNQAIDFIVELAGCYGMDVDKVISDMVNYRSSSDMWARTILWRSCSLVEPLSWWKGFFPGREITKIAVKILSLPATAASAERNWKAYSHVHTKKRNRLTVSNAMKLVYVKFNLEIFKNENMDELLVAQLKVNKENENQAEANSENENNFEISDDESDSEQYITYNETSDDESDIEVTNVKMMETDEEQEAVKENENMEDLDENMENICENREDENRDDKNRKILYLTTPGSFIVFDRISQEGTD